MSTSVSFPDAVRAGVNGSFLVDARSRRSEFGWWVVFTTAVNFLVQTGVLLLTAFVLNTWGVPAADYTLWVGVWLAFTVFLLLVPATFSVTARRLHDRNHSAWWMLLLFVPLVSWLLLGYLLFARSVEPNRWEPAFPGVLGAGLLEEDPSVSGQ